MPKTIRLGPVHLPLVRVLPVLFTLGYLAVVTDQAGRSITFLTDWGVAVTAAALSFGGGRWPLQVFLGQSALVVLASLLGQQAAVEAIFTLLMVAMAELAARRDGVRVTVGFVVATTVTVLASTRWHLAQVTPIHLLMVVCLVLAPLLVGGYVRSVRRLAGFAHERAVQLETQRQVLDTAVRAGERTAIARELHDILAHHVSSIAVRASGARQGAPPEMTAVLEDVHTAASTALTQLQRLMAILRDPDAGERELGPLLKAPTGLAAALEELAERTAEHTEVSVRVTGDLDGLDPAHGFAVMRVAQEGLTNVAKHSPAGSRTTLTVDTTTPALITVRVDTVSPPGASPPAPRPSSGWGLVGMRERVELLGGVLHVGPTDTGWLVEASLPASAADGSRPT